MDKRKFPRVTLSPSARPLAALLGAKVLWADSERLDLHDLSYTGAAFSRRPSVQANPGQQITLKIELAGQGQIVVPTEIIRVGDRVIACRFQELSASARLSLDRYLEDKIVGLHVRPVDPKYFAKPGGPTHWFHGPNNTNVLLWYDNMKLTQATVEIGQGFLQWQNGNFFETEVADIDVDDDGEVSSYFAVSPPPSSPIEGISPLMARVFEVLSQVEDPQKTLEPLLTAILERRR